ncbi:hypothetical protein PSTT_12866 [Puccinia striiformis]|uniref:Uncharacterized protein n=1 Tax=Puccinia striiformis TaxID=27350 RepID=A0A2S4UUA0_9BASI|nr:hypothetical protein PSTT_12866 [Puccinia striiformis]
METQRYEVDKLSDWLDDHCSDDDLKTLVQIAWTSIDSKLISIPYKYIRHDKKIGVADRSPFIFGPSHRSQQHSTGRPEDEDLETLAMFDALLEREKEVGEQSLWLGLDRARDDDDDNELVDDDYLSNDDYSD